MPSHYLFLLHSMFSFQGTSRQFYYPLTFEPQETQWSLNRNWSFIQPLGRIQFIRAADSLPSSLFTFNYSLKSKAFEMVGQSGLDLISIILRFASCNRSTKAAVLFCPFSFRKWWAKVDSNHRPHDYQSCALASWAIGPFHDDPCSHFSPGMYGGD